MLKPKFPLNQIIREGVTEYCPNCGSSMNKHWFSIKYNGCIQPECKNYYKGIKNERDRKLKTILKK